MTSPFASTGSAGVASGHPLATETGIEVLRCGGSAVDAALASAFTQWVVNAPQCGPGGELVALVADTGITGNSSNGNSSSDTSSDAQSGIWVYGGWSRAPLAIADEKPSGCGGLQEIGGPLNAVVPGSLRGAEALWRAHGRLGWTALFDGALAAAAGHTVTSRMAEVYAMAATQGQHEALQRILGQQTIPKQGDTIHLPELADTLKSVATHGADVFYLGELADRLVAAASGEGALLSHSDLEAMQASVETAQRFVFEDIVLWLTPAPSQASITAALLAVVPHDADPASREFAEAVAPITEQQLSEFCRRGTVLPSGTAVSTALDSSGLSATVVHSLASVPFGTGWVAGDTGMTFSNRVGTALSQRGDLPGCNPVPGGVLPHTLSAAHIQRRNSTGCTGWMTVATPGGDRQVQWLAQAIQRFRCGADAAAIAAEPRWFVCPTAGRFGVPAGIGEPWYAFAEPGITWHEDSEIAGYEVRRSANVGGGLQLVMHDGHNIKLASDPRSGGTPQTVSVW